QRQKFVLTRLASVAHAGENAAAGACDFLVTGALESHLELAGAVAAVDDVGVAVDQARRDQTIFQIVGWRVAPGGGQLRLGAGPGDRLACDSNRSTLDEPI